MARKSKYDIEAIGRDVRAGVLSLMEIARQHGCTDAYVHKLKKKHGWQRDLGPAVRKRSDAHLAREVSKPNASDEEIIEAAANEVTAIRKIHRRDIRNSQKLVDTLATQLSTIIMNRDVFEDAIIDETEYHGEKESKTAEAARLRKRAQMLKAVSIPAHVAAMRDLSVAQKNLIPLERQAFNLDDDGRRPEIIDGIEIKLVDAGEKK